MLVMQAQARLATLIRRLGRRPADVIVGRAFSATDSSIAR
jgi:hypothetical protein